MSSQKFVDLLKDNCVKFESKKKLLLAVQFILKGTLFTCREFCLRTNLVRPNYEPTNLTKLQKKKKKLQITDTIVAK